jgi:hypothetical protein
MSATTETVEKVDAVKPPTRWRNKWRVLTPVELFVRGVSYGERDPGEFDGQTEHPSKELAEQVAVNAARNNPEHYARLEYLGAFPVEAP